MRRRPSQSSANAADFDAVQRSRSANKEENPGVALVKAVAGRALKSPKVRVGLVLWVVGLFFMLLAPGLSIVTPEIKATYEGMVVEAANMPEYHERLYKTLVDQRQPVADKWAAELARAEREQEDKMKKARAYVGLWSDFGLADLRARFWSAFERGKIFAQQQTFYHMIMRVLSARDEDVLSMILNWPDPLSATAFVVLGFIGAASVVASYLLAIYGMVASGVYVIGKVVVRDALEQERRQQLRG
ncbi:unnamed protein product [Peronospora destructor]|uniref:DUF2937 family protein n=1 Tax=Peronospora destructor TaxID=86335 RepID=A0AAV0VD80_9STRA|nr:unnamed protein product [Peronospora destructor]